LLSLYFYILRTGLHIASACEDWFPKLASCGIVVLLLFHITTNIGMTIGLMPITGLPLPLISYGGSSLMTTLFSLSILLNFYANKEQVLFR
ncbi:MAG: Rod shape-determining protein RodA, partial [uncultured bacterium]